VTTRRLVTLLVVLAAIGLPAAVLHALCVGRSCDATTATESRVPFCPLDATLREAIANGYREGRSPDVLGVAGDVPVYTEIGGARIAWPRAQPDTRVPIVFWGAGVAGGGALPENVTLDAIAPTVSDVLGFERPFPEVRSGRAIDGVAERASPPPRLVLLIAWKTTGTPDLEEQQDAWPFLASMIDDAIGTLDARTGSLPMDPAATLTTIGTGGLPSQHGITGSYLRNDEGQLTRAFDDPNAPVQVIATLADDLEEADPSTLVGVVATDRRDAGIVGGGWYEGQDPVDVVIGDADALPVGIDVYLRTGYGGDDVPDVLGVVLSGGVERLDRLTRRIVRAAERATDGAVLVVVAGTGTTERTRTALPDTSIVEAVEEAVPSPRSVVAAAVAGGLFLDQQVLTQAELSGQVAVDAMLGVTTQDGGAMIADAFQGFAVSFARYC
jgi:hypothetical protein